MSAFDLDLGQFFSLALDMLCIASTDGYLLKVNKFWEDVLGYSIAELEGSRFLDYVHPDDIEDTLRAMSDLDAQHPILNFTNRYRCKDGSYRFLEWRSHPRGTLIFAAARDITERIQVEQQAALLRLEQERVKLLSQFISQSSHEFRTPLTIIQSSLHLLNKTDDVERRKQKTQTIEEQIARIARLVDTLQTMIRLDSQTSRVSQATDCNQLVRAAVYHVTSSVAVDGDVEVRLELSPGLPQLLAVPDQLREALWQIVDNAMRFTPVGGYVLIRTFQKDNSIVIVVEDSGIGISEKDLPHVFERFYRIDEAYSTPGFGLGLLIARAIVEQHRGTITVDSELGKGTTVTIELPAIPEAVAV